MMTVAELSDKPRYITHLNGMSNHKTVSKLIALRKPYIEKEIIGYLVNISVS